MVESNIVRQTATHHERRRNRNVPRHSDSDGANSRTPESTRRDKQHGHHEENSRKERNTNMSKRTKRTKTIISSLTLLLISSLSASAADIRNRQQRSDEVRTIVNAETVERDIRLDNDDELRFDERQIRLSLRQDARLGRTLNTFENVARIDSQLERVANRRNDRDNTARDGGDQTRGDFQLANRSNADRAARNFLALRELGSDADLSFGNDRERRLDDLNS